MKAEKKSFVMHFDWYSSISDCTLEEKGWLLEAIYRYQIFGELPETSDRFLKNLFNTMRSFFDENSKKYAERCVLNSLNQSKRWAKDAEADAFIDEKIRYLKSHSLEEYTEVYGRIRTNTDNDTDNVFDSDNDSESDNVFDSDNDSKNDTDGEDVQKERKPITLSELKEYHALGGYTFDCQKAFRAKTKPLYREQLHEQCELWEAVDGSKQGKDSKR